MTAGLAGGIGAGTATVLTASIVGGPFVGLDRVRDGLRPEHLSLLLCFVTVVAVAGLAGRWGWLVATVGLALQVALLEASSPTAWEAFGFVAMLVVGAGAALGGALAAFEGTDRAVRLAIVAGLAVGAGGGWNLDLEVPDTLPQRLLPAVLVLLAAVAWLALGAGRAGRAVPSALAIGAVAVVVALVGVVVAVLVSGRIVEPLLPDVLRTYEGRLDGIYLAFLASLVLAGTGYLAGRAEAAQLVVVGFAAGLAWSAQLLPQFRYTYDSVWVAPAAAAGGVAGVLLIRSMQAVPWDVLALFSAAALLVATSPDLRDLRALSGLQGDDVVGHVAIVFLLSAALATAAGRVVIQHSAAHNVLRATMPVALASGFTAFALTVILTMYRVERSLVADPVVGKRVGITIGVAALVALALFVLSLRTRTKSPTIAADSLPATANP